MRALERAAYRLAGVVLVLMCCAYSHTLAAVLLITAALVALAVMWANALAEVKAEEMYEQKLADTEYRVWWNSAVVLGKGYEDGH